MASRSGYTVERLREIGRLSADQARNILERAVFARPKALTFEYCGIVTTEGSVEAGLAVRASSYVAYRWTVARDGFEEQHAAHHLRWNAPQRHAVRPRRRRLGCRCCLRSGAAGGTGMQPPGPHVRGGGGAGGGTGGGAAALRKGIAAVAAQMVAAVAPRHAAASSGSHREVRRSRQLCGAKFRARSFWRGAWRCRNQEPHPVHSMLVVYVSSAANRSIACGEGSMPSMSR